MLASLGSGLLGNIFGNKLSTLSNVISNASGVKTGSVLSLLGLVVPVLVSVLGKQVTSQDMSISSFVSLLMSQKNTVQIALATGIGSPLNISGLGVFLGNSKQTVTNTYNEDVNNKKRFMVTVDTIS